jgi:hypothetical protein
MINVTEIDQMKPDQISADKCGVKQLLVAEILRIIAK